MMLALKNRNYLKQFNITGRVDGITQFRVLPFGQVVLLFAKCLLLSAHVLRSDECNSINKYIIVPLYTKCIRNAYEK